MEILNGEGLENLHQFGEVIIVLRQKVVSRRHHHTFQDRVEIIGWTKLMRKKNTSCWSQKSEAPVKRLSHLYHLSGTVQFY